MTGLKIQPRPSPNHGPRPDGVGVDMLVLHYTGMETAAAALERMCDPEAQVSAHYMIDEDGSTLQFVPEDCRAWHAGVAFWAGETNINDRSVGIELVNPGHEFGYRPFPEPQMEALEAVAAAIVERHAIPAHRVLGHSDVAPSRKQDPGELFDWPRLARAGIGLWPAAQADVEAGTEPAHDLLSKFGYQVGVDGDTRLALEAFQRHFRPARIDGAADGECIALLRDLCRRMG